MADEPRILLFGASVRAAAFSALRAGLQPWCADLFADTDLVACCPAQALPVTEYPEGFLEVSARAPQGPWMYTGGLENRPALIEAMSRHRQLWGNGAAVLRQVRSPAVLAECLDRAGIAYPAVRLHAADIPRRGHWLVKPLDGTGGRGIAFVEDRAALNQCRHVYYQEHVEGEPCSAVFLGWEEPQSEGSVPRAFLLGATRQLIGEPWLHAAPFHYCGSIGPLPLSAGLHEQFARLGNLLVNAFRLRGLFGVDCVVRDGVPWPVEVNPRYPASVEVLERPNTPSAVALHRMAFESSTHPVAEWRPLPDAQVRGKAILFAREALVFPGSDQGHDFRTPAFADIPTAGQRIEKDRPILTFFAEAASVDRCQARLQAMAAHLDRGLFDR